MNTKKLYLASYIFIAVFVLFTLIVFPKWIVDDAFLRFRYADNVVRHGHLTFNVGENPVEGYTGVLLPLSIAMAVWIGIRPTVAAHLIGIFSFVLSLIFFFRLLLRLHTTVSLSIASLLLMATAAFLYTHVYSGLETLLFTALLLGSSLQLHSLLNASSVSFWYHALLGGTLLALSLCRPEGIAYALIAAGLLIAVSLIRFKSFRPTIAYVLCFGIPFLLYFIWRWNYYGYFLPNTFYAKLHNTSTISYSTLISMKDWGRQYLLLPTFGVAATWMVSLDETRVFLYLNRREHLKIANLFTLGALLLFAGIVLVQYLRSNLVMNFSYRFYVPIYPIALLALAWFLSPSFEATRLHRYDRTWTYVLVLCGLCILLVTQVVFQMEWLITKEIPFTSQYETTLSEMHITAGKYLKRRVPVSEWLVVHIDAGAIPYYSGLKTIDFGGLNDEYLAHNKEVSLQKRVDYFFSKNPGAVVFTSYNWDCIDHGPEADAITSDPRFENYALVRRFGNSIGRNYFEFVFLRRDLLNAGKEKAIPIKTCIRH